MSHDAIDDLEHAEGLLGEAGLLTGYCRPTCADGCPGEFCGCPCHDQPAASDAEVLDRLAHLLRAPEWPGASGMEDVAELVALTGRDLTTDPEADWPRH